MRQIFINLPVADLEKSKGFYIELGFTDNTLFSDEHQECMVWSEHIYVMLMTHEKFMSYSKKPISVNRNYTNTYFTLPVESLDKVNEIAVSGLRGGGIEPIPMIDEGFMQIRRIEDFDGHTWDIIFLDLDKFKIS